MAKAMLIDTKSFADILNTLRAGQNIVKAITGAGYCMDDLGYTMYKSERKQKQMYRALQIRGALGLMKKLDKGEKGSLDIVNNIVDLFSGKVKKKDVAVDIGGVFDPSSVLTSHGDEKEGEENVEE